MADADENTPTVFDEIGAAVVDTVKAVALASVNAGRKLERDANETAARKFLANLTEGRIVDIDAVVTEALAGDEPPEEEPSKDREAE